MQTPDIPTFVIDGKFKRDLAAKLPSMNEPDILSLWFDCIPDARRDLAGDATDARLYVCGMLITEMRRRAIGQRSIERLHRCQVLFADMEQVATHIKQRAMQSDPRSQAAGKGLWVPGMDE